MLEWRCRRCSKWYCYPTYDHCADCNIPRAQYTANLVEESGTRNGPAVRLPRSFHSLPPAPAIPHSAAPNPPGIPQPSAPNPTTIIPSAPELPAITLPSASDPPPSAHPVQTLPESRTVGATAPLPYERQPSRVDLIQQQIDLQEAQEQWDRIMERWNTSRTQFRDEEFQPVDKSLYYDHQPDRSGPLIGWRRVAAIETMDNNREPWVVLKDPRATDIEQGTLGNCWFVSALSVVAERPELIDKILVTREVNPAGVYQVRLFHDGNWRTVTIDDYLPCDRDLLIYSQARRKQLWVSLIEKAAAKLHGCYEALIAGHSIESLRMLTGAPCETLVITEFSDDELWAILLSCYESNFLFGASSGSGETSNDAEFEAKGLRKKHAYSVLDIKEANQMRLIKLKNPWARFGWNGDWCATSDFWNIIPEKQRADMLRDCTGNESIFWMCLADFKQYFSAVDICRLRSDWDDWEQINLGCLLPVLRFFNNPERKSDSVKVSVVKVERTTEVELVLQQSSVRQSSNLSLVDLGLIVLRGDISNPRCPILTENKRNIRLFTNLHTVLDPGVYSIIRYSFGLWHSHNTPTYSVLSIYSRFQISNEEHPMKETILRDALIAVVESRGEKNESREGITCYYLQKGWCGMLLMAENRTHFHLHVECSCTDSINVVSSRGALQTKDSIPPLSRQLLMVLTQVEVYEKYAIYHRLLTKLSQTAGLDGSRSRTTELHQPALEGKLHEAQRL